MGKHIKFYSGEVGEEDEKILLKYNYRLVEIENLSQTNKLHIYDPKNELKFIIMELVCAALIQRIIISNQVIRIKRIQ